MQCDAQGAPLVGISLTVLNRRNIKAWAESHGLAGRDREPDGEAPERTFLGPSSATDADR